MFLRNKCRLTNFRTILDQVTILVKLVLGNHDIANTLSTILTDIESRLNDRPFAKERIIQLSTQ